MKVFSASQIRAWDEYTIRHEPIPSLALMDRAAQTFADWLMKYCLTPARPVFFICGTGNNGGDGIAAARLLHWAGFDAKVVVCDFAAKHSADFDGQMAQLPRHENLDLYWLKSPGELPDIPQNTLIVDALFGTGLRDVLDGDWASIVEKMNLLDNEIISIDLPSGLLADTHTPGNAVVRASRTFTFERPKLAMFFPENADRVGEWTCNSIGLATDFERQAETPFFYLTHLGAACLRKTRKKFAHKGGFGHAMLVAGSFGKMGAAVLAARACLRSGVGLLTVHAPRCGNLVLQTSVPEAMFSADARARFCSNIPATDAFHAVGIGPGIGKSPETAVALQEFLTQIHDPLVLDADALNLLAEYPDWWRLIPHYSIITPHPKEFERLFGKSDNDFQRNELQRRMALDKRVFIVLKGAHTAIACPDGECWFNTTGNPGMATGGSGDVLTGILTGLLAQGYDPKTASLLGVYLHGLAGDQAAAAMGQEALVAGDLVEFLWRGM
ncbi:MAG: NAD(P)H-hydrate dehydratase [Saprospiraceae bacterium]|nr:NAD(P)H-hydrate dehydratase [Saprospiraceae bacterium]